MKLTSFHSSCLCSYFCLSCRVDLLGSARLRVIDDFWTTMMMNCCHCHLVSPFLSRLYRFRSLFLLQALHDWQRSDGSTCASTCSSSSATRSLWRSVPSRMLSFVLRSSHLFRLELAYDQIVRIQLLIVFLTICARRNFLIDLRFSLTSAEPYLCYLTCVLTVSSCHFLPRLTGLMNFCRLQTTWTSNCLLCVFSSVVPAFRHASVWFTS